MRRSTARHGRMITGAAAFTTLVLCLGGAAPALAATTQVKPVKDPLASVRTKALTDITAYGKRLSVVLHPGASTAALSPDELFALHAAGVLEGVALRDDRVAVSRAKTRKAVLAAVSSAQRTLSVASLQLAVSTAAEAHLAADSQIGDDAATLSDQATTVAAAGADTTEVTDALAAVSADLESAQADESATVGDVLDLDAAASTAALKAAAATALSDLGVVDQDISDATDDLAAAQAAYDSLAGTADGS
ncbi:MAG: hypothetical protein QOE76_2512 [Frankiales bacterium]|nr:hypothetical protein [Frankiales bacterium]